MSGIDIKMEFASFEKNVLAKKKKMFPELMAETLDLTTESTLQDVRALTRSRFDLKTEWVPKSIRRFPDSANQKRKIARDVAKKGKFNASIYARPWLEFMTPHEIGYTRTATKGQKYVALPGRGLKKLKYRTGTGKTKKRYSPSTLLKDYNNNGGKHDRQKIRRKRTVGKPFIIEKEGRISIVRRKGKNWFDLETLYTLKKRTTIKKEWGFENEVRRSVRGSYRNDFKAAFKKMKRKYGSMK